MPMVLPCASLPISALRLTLASRRSARSDFEDALGQRQQHAERVLGDRIGVAAGLIDDQDARRRAGIDVHGVEARAVR